MYIPGFETSQKLIDILEQEMLLKAAQAQGARVAWLEAKLEFCRKGYRFKEGQRICVRYGDGAREYVFKKIDWHWTNDEAPVIFAQTILKSGKLSKCEAEALISSNGGVPWDAMFVVSVATK